MAETDQVVQAADCCCDGPEPPGWSLARRLIRGVRMM